MKFVQRDRVLEFALESGKEYDDPFNDVEVDALFEGPDGVERVVPAFWAGDGVWRIRFSSPVEGEHRYRTVCSDTSNPDLRGREGTVKVTPYRGENPLLAHGPLRVPSNGRHLEHEDGTPFFWLGDTWWMGLTRRLIWPDEFQLLTVDRVQKGFTVIQIVAGLYPDMPAFDERGANEAGFPWKEDYSRINPAYFDMADLRIAWLVSSGLVPCIVGCWGYFLPWMGVETVKKHWRNLVARYGAYPVVWCLAGEATMPYYLSEHKEQDRRLQKKGWTELFAYVRGIDPYRRPATIHPGDPARSMVEDPSLLDIDMVHTGHGDRGSVPNTVKLVTESRASTPEMPVINGEVCYEGILAANREEIQRMVFWACMLSGAAGHTYGANGIWQVNTCEVPFGPSPHGRSWGDTPWEAAYRVPGSTHLGVGKRLLERFPWWRFEPHPEWAEPHWTSANYFQPYAAGIPGRVRLFYVPATSRLSCVRGIESGAEYRAYYFDPKNGKECPVGTVRPDDGGTWSPPAPEIMQDWILVLHA